MMSDASPTIAEGQAPDRVLGLPAAAWGGLLLGGLASLGSYLAVGSTLGLFFAGVLFAALLVPPLVLAEERLIDRLLVAAAVNDGIALIWLIPVFGGAITLFQGLLCYIVLVCWCFALTGLAAGFNRLGSHIPAAAMTLALALGWLSSPIWLSSPAAEFVASKIVPIHPLFALNGAAPQLGLWSERPIAYRHLLNLGQDVAYELPRGVLAMAAVHLLAGAIGFAACWAVRGRR